MRFGMNDGGQDTTTDELRTVWRIADEAGFDHVWVFDHLASIGAGGPDRPVFEGWAMQAAMADLQRSVIAARAGVHRKVLRHLLHEHL